VTSEKVMQLAGGRAIAERGTTWRENCEKNEIMRSFANLKPI
jgi:hypothetical protein